MHRGLHPALAPAVAIARLSPESYVVRIYRRAARRPTRILGTVEQVGRSGELGFKTLRELQRILTGTAPAKS